MLIFQLLALLAISLILENIMHLLDILIFFHEKFGCQVLEVIKRKPNLHKISFVAHSVGGLVARYAIGRLYRPCNKSRSGSACNLEDDFKGTIGGLEAMNFITVASPHLGSRGNKQVLLSVLFFPLS